MSSAPKVVAVPTPSQEVITGCNLLQSNFNCAQVLSRLQCTANLMGKRHSTAGPFWTMHKHKDLIISDEKFLIISHLVIPLSNWGRVPIQFVSIPVAADTKPLLLKLASPTTPSNAYRVDIGSVSIIDPQSGQEYQCLLPLMYMT